jgi:hypothetical protein
MVSVRLSLLSLEYRLIATLGLQTHFHFAKLCRERTKSYAFGQRSYPRHDASDAGLHRICCNSGMVSSLSLERQSWCIAGSVCTHVIACLFTIRLGDWFREFLHQYYWPLWRSWWDGRGLQPHDVVELVSNNCGPMHNSDWPSYVARYFLVPHRLSAFLQRTVRWQESGKNGRLWKLLQKTVLLKIQFHSVCWSICHYLCSQYMSSLFVNLLHLPLFWSLWYFEHINKACGGCYCWSKCVILMFLHMLTSVGQ